MSYKSFEEAREDWIHEESTIIKEYEDVGLHLVICVYDGYLYIIRFFTLGANQWVASTDYSEKVNSIGDV